jgi:hypothetical protein
MRSATPPWAGAAQPMVPPTFHVVQLSTADSIEINIYTSDVHDFRNLA